MQLGGLLSRQGLPTPLSHMTDSMPLGLGISFLQGSTLAPPFPKPSEMAIGHQHIRGRVEGETWGVGAGRGSEHTTHEPEPSQAPSRDKGVRAHGPGEPRQGSTGAGPGHTELRSALPQETNPPGKPALKHYGPS